MGRVERARKASSGFSVSVEGGTARLRPTPAPSLSDQGTASFLAASPVSLLAQSCPRHSGGSCHAVPPSPESVFSLRGTWSWSTLFFHSSYQVEWMKHTVEREKGVISVPEGASWPSSCARPALPSVQRPLCSSEPCGGGRRGPGFC